MPAYVTRHPSDRHGGGGGGRGRHAGTGRHGSCSYGEWGPRRAAGLHLPGRTDPPISRMSRHPTKQVTKVSEPSSVQRIPTDSQTPSFQHRPTSSERASSDHVRRTAGHTNRHEQQQAPGAQHPARKKRSTQTEEAPCFTRPSRASSPPAPPPQAVVKSSPWFFRDSRSNPPRRVARAPAE